MKIWSCIATFLFSALSLSSIAASPQSLTLSERNVLVPSRICLDNAGNLLAKGVLTAEQHKVAVGECMTTAEKALGRSITHNDLQMQVGTSYELSTSQKVVGWVFAFSILQLFGAVGIAGFGCMLAFYALPAIKEIPKSFYEGLLYLSALGVTAYSYAWGSVSPMAGFLGSLLFAGALAFSAKIHDWKGAPWKYFGLVMIYSATVALLYQSQLVGVIAVGALMFATGFMAEAFGLGFAVGFKDDRSASIATGTAFLVLGLYVVMRMFELDNRYLQVFSSGAYWMGTFVGFIGLLILSSKWYASKQKYLLMNILMIVAGITAIVIGSVWNIPEVQKIGGTIFALWMIEKYVEITFRGLLSSSFFGLVGSLGLYFLAGIAIQNAEKVGPYLLFLS